MFYNPTGFFTLTKKEVHRFMKVYLQTMVAPLFNSLLFLGVFGGVLRTRQVGLEGIGYLSFLVPGLCAMAAITGSFQNSSSSLVQQKYLDIIHDLNTYPLSTLEKLSAYALAGALRGLLVGSITWFACTFFTSFSINNPIMFFVMLFIVSFFFSVMGIITGLYLKTFDQMSLIQNIVLTPLVYFGGVFFEVSKLPGILSKIAVYNPLFPFIDSIRFSYLGISEGAIYTNITFFSICLIISFTIAYQMVKRGVGVTD